MDAIYQAIKNLVKAFVNIFISLVDLLSGLLNGVAYVLGKLRPNISEKFHAIGDDTEVTAKHQGMKANIHFSGREEELVAEIRNELKEKVTSRERYYYLRTLAEENGDGFYFIVLSILVFALFGSTMLYSVGSSNATRILAAFVMAALCAVACVTIANYRKKVARRHLMKLILEEEFKDQWNEEKTKTEDAAGDASGAKIHPISEVNREEIG